MSKTSRWVDLVVALWMFSVSMFIVVSSIDERRFVWTLIGAGLGLISGLIVYDSWTRGRDRS
jgi:hypothetical protein